MGVLLVDDHVLFAEALRSWLEEHHVKVVGWARDGLEAVEKVRALHPDVVLMDINMPRCNGIEATRLIKTESPNVKVVILTMSTDDNDLFSAMKCGASGYITKDTDPHVFLELLAGLARGEMAVTRMTASRIMSEFTRAGQRAPVPQTASVPATRGRKKSRADLVLSPRQTDILRLIARGHTYKEIAVTLAISERTVNYHVNETLGKLRLQNRAQAIAYATRHGLIEGADTASGW
jgi:two-component system NarL family response regulator